jgi:hypothetical protein
MKREDFIKTMVTGTAVLASDSLHALSSEVVQLDGAKGLDPLIPINIFDKSLDEIVKQMIELRTKYGFRRYTILTPLKSVRFAGFPDRQTYVDTGNTILKLREKLAGYDVEIGWELSCTIKQGPGAPFQFITGIDGKVSDISYCPLDEGFQKVLAGNITTVVSIARPFLIQMEDDFKLSHAGFGCFCPLHMEAFSNRLKRTYSRESLLELFNTFTKESFDVRKAWADFSRESLVNIASFIREKVDELAPETRISLCQPGNADFEGNFTESVTRAFAGKTRPAVRLYGADYGKDHAERIPDLIFHALYSGKHLPADFELFHESDTFPHTRFFISNAKIKSLMTAAFAYGMHDTRYHPIQGTDNPLEERGYAEMYRKEVARFSALKETIQGTEVVGCEIVYDPLEQLVPTKGRLYAWANVTGRLGIPHTASNGRVKMVAGSASIQTRTDEQVVELLSGGVFLDGTAAHAICERGFGHLIGAEVLPGGKPNFIFEGVRKPAEFPGVKGELMYNFLLFGQVGTEGGDFFQLKPMKEAEVLTEFLDGNEAPVVPGMIRYKNNLGGRVAITAFDLKNNSSSATINYKKKEIIRQTIEWLGEEPLPAFVSELPNVFCIVNRSISNNYSIITLINLCADSFDYIPLVLAPEWDNSKIELMNSMGKWVKVKSEKTKAGAWKIMTSLSYLTPVVVRVTKIK